MPKKSIKQMPREYLRLVIQVECSESNAKAMRETYDSLLRNQIMFDKDKQKVLKVEQIRLLGVHY